MAVIVKTFPDLDATGYVSVAEFSAWCAQNLKDTTGKTLDQLGKAVNDAALYMDTRFAFVGYRKDKAQEREWPRECAWDSRGDRVEGVPKAVKDAACAYAFIALSTELMAGPIRDDSGRVVKSKSEKVGPIAEEVEYDTFGGYELPIYPAIDRQLYRHGLVCRKGGIGVGSVERG